MGRKIYIVLTNTGTLLSKMIGIYTREDLNHVSIAFDEQLNEMYSFGRKYQSNPFIAGFICENAVDRIFQGADCAIFSYEVNDKKYDRMRRRIRHMEKNKNQYKYNFIGLFGVAVNKEIKRDGAFFCSQFVATVVNEGGMPMFSIKPSLVQPHHFSQLACLQTVFEGDLQTYLKTVRKEGERPLVPISMWRFLAFRLLA